MATTLFTDIFHDINLALTNYVATTSGDVISFISPIFTNMMIVSVAIWGYQVVFGQSNAMITEGIYKIIRFGFIITLGLTAGNYSSIVVEFLQKGPESLSAIVSGSVTGTSEGALDQFISTVFDVAGAAWEKGGVLDGDFGMYIIAGLIMGFGGALTVITAFLILLSKMMTAILLAVGPVFITLALFNATQRFFEAWLGMICNHGLILVMTAALGKLLIDLANNFVSGLAGGDASALATLADASKLCIVFALCILILKQVPQISSAIGGGLALATNGVIGGALNAMRPTTINRQMRQIQRDGRLAGRAALRTGKTLAAPAALAYQGGQKAIGAYQKRFGADNSITQSQNKQPV